MFKQSNRLRLCEMNDIFAVVPIRNTAKRVVNRCIQSGIQINKILSITTTGANTIGFLSCKKKSIVVSFPKLK